MFGLLGLQASSLRAQTGELDKYNIVWNSQSHNSGESMPCGGGDVGLNVWVENGDLLIYLAQSGAFDENNTLLKLGRVRVKLFPNPFAGKTFKQELVLRDGNIVITGTNNTKITVWVDIFNPTVHIEIKSAKLISAKAAYESWRYRDRIMKGRENNQSSWKFGAPPNTVTYADTISYHGKNSVQFYHRNRDSTIFDATVRQQGIQSVKAGMYNPLSELISGGELCGDDNMVVAQKTSDGIYNGTDYRSWQIQSRKPGTEFHIDAFLLIAKAKTVGDWQTALFHKQHGPLSHVPYDKTKEANITYWHHYWDKSFICINPDDANPADSVWQAGRNYQLFRYMLGCNAYGSSPTKFNGGLFTYDPVFVNKDYAYTPDFRNWGGGLMTAQNQRLVYFPMLKNGDWDMMKPQFDFYLKSLHNAELRSRVYWNHAGASFTEQIENFGLPNYAEYGTKRPAGFDKGVEYNNWLEYEWDTVFQFCLMMLDVERYTGKDISHYIPLIESCLTFYDEHYQYLAKQRGESPLDENGKLKLYPGSAAETYKVTNNSTTTIAALQGTLTRLLALPDHYLSKEKKEHWTQMLTRIPPISFREFDGHKTIAPAQKWERINNTEPAELYAVFPWHLYGVGKPDLQTAINTWQYDTDAIKFRSFIGWKQDNIFAADMGLTKEAAELTILKMKDSGRRFPAFWGPGFDWAPDHNWGGSGMIGLQEMLLQTDNRKIYLFPAWPKDWAVHFKLHAPYNTTIEAVLKNGKVQSLKVTPVERIKDVINLLK
ncbi:DUF5703 domain-containing protein [Mucilaginibacter sp. PPCGB 2223]|uniref:DUF5703 domain-containing protein n=1 Tax=Mucilaginibacter sp. PPCGB 2223 TaxID=1886027 RepID=UPI0020C817C9|nr:DUF5703 domain-containing protein [Mucilaginibacter sp. PPCGB 2223]